ncbi:SIR2 family protein [Dyadobacter frigoris]|uniref:Uncharacterized protein n=1 Tax=Dyadobacter frigoris TaxID=2576211 RepID=A0A4U6DBU4_9BACT|nr:SIR2 family protein [Dyadobacter frigoris]TKT94265.1 hypothetical protein FDK13_03365 [Dyadobacter frigoris]GLU50545.1 hypothetical protein Dfri01_00060 [Dyadobacter frigoris]
MHWPKALVTELAARRCIIFLGAGASAGSLSHDGSKNPPTWENFLKGMVDLIPDTPDKLMIADFLKTGKYLEAAEVIYTLLPKADYSRSIREELDLPRYGPSKIHECVLQLDPKIVITTNYDKIYDNYCTNGVASDGYNISKYYDDHLLTDVRSPVRIIVKAHGCVSDANKIVLTKSQYFKARKDYSNFYKVLDSLFLSHTILFVGYSLNDPDIQLVLENVNITAPTPHPHYFITANNLHQIIKNYNTNTYNLEFIEYEEGNYDQLNEGLYDLLLEVQQVRQSNPSV